MVLLAGVRFPYVSPKRLAGSNPVGHPSTSLRLRGELQAQTRRAQGLRTHSFGGEVLVV